MIAASVVFLKKTPEISASILYCCQKIPGPFKSQTRCQWLQAGWQLAKSKELKISVPACLYLGSDAGTGISSTSSASAAQPCGFYSKSRGTGFALRAENPRGTRTPLGMGNIRYSP